MGFSSEENQDSGIRSKILLSPEGLRLVLADFLPTIGGKLCAGIMLAPTVTVLRTDKFSVLCNVDLDRVAFYDVDMDINCSYSAGVIASAVRRRYWCSATGDSSVSTFPVQIKDFENIVWEPVMSGNCGASSYLVRKGLSRKAQLSLQLRRYCSKNPCSILHFAVPKTVILDTWNAFEEMKLDFGRGTFASFDDHSITKAPLRQRLDWCLVDARATMEDESHAGKTWILKPSVTNKGMDIAVVNDWDGVLDALEDADHVREWVLQRYIERPLLVGGHKFHLRVYVLCVGALRVFVYDRILMLIAAHKYDPLDLEDIYGHLTNTARAAEDVNFDEAKFVRILEDLPQYLAKRRTDICPDLASATAAVQGIREEIHRITADVFGAYENEYSIFCPMSNCFEVYGLDFMVDDDLKVHFLEVNPGPDFKQTGGRLQGLIARLWEQINVIVLDSGLIHPAVTSSGKSQSEVDAELLSLWKSNAPDFTMVYSKEWSAAKHKGGMKFES